LLNISYLDSRLKLPLRFAHPMRYLTRSGGLHAPAGAFSVKVESAPEMSVEEGNYRMAVKVLIPTPLRQFTGKQASIECNAATV